MNPLHISARTLLKTYGDQFCTDRLFINYLSDNSHFEPEALKNIMGIIVNEGYARGLVDTKLKNDNWNVYTIDAISKIEKQYGFQHNYVAYCFQCLCYGLQLTDHVDQSLINADNTWAPQQPNAYNNPQADNTNTYQQPQFQPWTANTANSSSSTISQRARQQSSQHQRQQQQQQPHFAQWMSYPGDITKKRIRCGCIFLTLFLLFLISFIIITINKIKKESELKYDTYHYLNQSPDVNFDDMDNTYDLDEYDNDSSETSIYSDSTFNMLMDSIMKQDYDSIINEAIESSQRDIEQALSEINQITQGINNRSTTSSTSRSSVPPPPPPPSPTPPPPPSYYSNDEDQSQTQQQEQPAQRESRTRRIRRKAKEYYQRAKESVMEALDIDQEEMKERWDETKEEIKERWGEMKEDILDRWHDIRNR